MSNNTNAGIGHLPILTLIFITLKLCGVISWSWWLVLSPTLILLGIIAATIFFVGAIELIRTMNK